MIYKILLVLLLNLFMSTSTLAGNVIQFDKDIVDVNGKIEIIVDKIAVKSIFQTQKDTGIHAQVLMVDKLHRILLHQDELLKAINTVSKGPDTSFYNEFSKHLNSFYASLRSDSILKTDALAQVTLYKSLKQRPSTLDRFIIQHFISLADEIAHSIDTVLEKSNTKFVLRAYKQDQNGSTDLHIENFDVLASQSYYEVSRWILSLSPNDKQKLQDYQTLSDSLNKDYSKALLNIGDRLTHSLATPDAITELYEYCNQTAIALNDSASSIANEIKAIVIDCKTNLQELDSISLKLIQDVRSGDILAISTKYDAISSRAQKIINTLSSYQLDKYPAYANSVIENLKQESNKLKAAYEKDKSTISNFVPIIRDALDPCSKISGSSEIVNAKIKKFTYSSIPDRGYIDLKFTGRREENDKIFIKAALVSPFDSSGIKYKEEIIDEKTITMFKLGPHSTVNVSFVMAFPLRQYDHRNEVKLMKEFQFAPSASVLFKYGFSSSFYCKYLDFGVGIASILPDFNLDGTPDRCLGIAFTGLRDIIIVGVAYNFETDVPFTYFGVSLPFLDFLSFPTTKSSN